MLLVVPPAMAVSPMHFEPAMQLTLQLSTPEATEEERDLLRREYRLSQGASAFWVGFDSLNARIHGAADLLRNLHSLAGDVEVNPLDRQPLRVNLEAAPVEPVPLAAALPQAPATSPRPAVETDESRWMLGAAETVHSHFNVKVPGWDEGVSGVPLRSFFEEENGAGCEIPGLEQLPHILAKIQATWPDASCQEYLRHLLVDNRDGERMGFPVSVVAEILLLEDVLNDRLAGHA